MFGNLKEMSNLNAIRLGLNMVQEVNQIFLSQFFIFI